MAIDQKAFDKALDVYRSVRGYRHRSAALEAAIEAYEAARKQEPERPMLNRIAEYIGAVRHQDVPSLRIAHGVLDFIAKPSATVVEDAVRSVHSDPKLVFLDHWRAAIQRIRDGG